MWKGRVDDRCINCGEFIEPQRMPREVEEKIEKEIKKDHDYFARKPSDRELTRQTKKFFNSLRWGIYYLELAFFAFITLILFLISLFAA